MLLKYKTPNHKWLFFFPLIFQSEKIKQHLFMFFKVKYKIGGTSVKSFIKTFCDKQMYFMHLIICKRISLFAYDFMSDITVVHNPEKTLVFSLQIMLRNLHKTTILMNSFQFTNKTEIPSICLLYKAANWSEREIFDMFGICFYNHPNLRRILTDYGFKGFPLLKSFPVYGFKELRFDLQNQQLIYTPVILTQKWRNYLFLRQWK